jgi:two-component system CheB/CheR fusion protein
MAKRKSASKPPARKKTASGARKPKPERKLAGGNRQARTYEAKTSPAVEAARAPRPRVYEAPPEMPFPVVGVGASAGGLEAFQSLLQALPKDLGMAVVLVQHLDPNHASALPDLLASSSSMPVRQVTDGIAIEPNTVYVVPPNAQMAMLDGKLHLIPRPTDSSQHMPIDFFFRSLAHAAQQRTIGVVLSGTGSDGAAGLREIKGAGGITFAQDPPTAKYDGMPRAAIALEVVDMVKPPDEIGDEIVRIARHPYVRRVEETREEPESDRFNDQLSKVFAILRHSTGVDFTHYKQPTIQRRLQRRMVLHKMNKLEDYLALLRSNPPEVQALYGDILIHVTRFFRDPDSFAILEQQVFPRIMDQRRSHESPARIWIPGCATGEEPYSIAIALLEYLGEDANSVPVQIFATDVSERAVQHARTGMYPESISADVSVERLHRYFNRVDGSYRVSKQVRDLCVFARQDLTRDPPFSKLDLIVCRNVLIYLGTVLQKRLMNVFHYALKPGGFLMLGSAETVGTSTDLFSVEDKRHRLYVRKQADFPREFELSAHGPLHEHPHLARPPQPAENRSHSTLQTEANRIVLSRYAPAGVLVDEELQIVQFRGHTGPFLEPAPGDATLNLLKMAREGLLYGLRSALYEARKSDTSVRKAGLRVLYEGAVRDVEIEVIPVVVDSQKRHFLVLFHSATIPPVERAAKAKKGKKGKVAKTPRELTRISRLQEELAASRQYLQSIIQDLEAANEELQSANEEILSSNEELQSTNEELDTAKEELQSTNEELNTVNEELQGRNEELSRLNSDLMNLLGSVEIAIVMVTSDLRIRRFTPMAERVLNLLPHDVGRRISDIKPNIEVPELARLIVETIKSATIREVEVHDRNGKGYSLRIRPYKNIDKRIDGAVLALFEHRAPHSADGNGDLADSIASNGSFTQALIDVVPEPILLLRHDHRVVRANEAFCRFFGVINDDTEGRNIFAIVDRQLDVPSMRDLLQRQLPQQPQIDGMPFDEEFVGLGRRQASVSARQLRSAEDELQTVILFQPRLPVGAEKKVRE